MPPIRSPRPRPSRISLTSPLPYTKDHARRNVVRIPGQSHEQSQTVHQLFDTHTIFAQLSALPNDATREIPRNWAILYQLTTDAQDLNKTLLDMLETYVHTQRIVHNGYQQVRQAALEHFCQTAPNHILSPPSDSPSEVIDLTETEVIDLTKDDNLEPSTNSQAVQTSPPTSPINYNVPTPTNTPELTPDSPATSNPPKLGAGPLHCQLHRETQHQFVSSYCDCPQYICPYCLKVQPGHIVTDCPDYGDGQPAAWMDTATEQAIQCSQQAVRRSRPASR